jgi:DNA-binding CsgD family transcriptional regulator
MNPKERWVVVRVLGVIAVLVAWDLITDSREGVVLWHLMMEGVAGIFALTGIFYLLSGTITLRQRLQKEMDSFSAFKREAETWRMESKKYIEGLSLAIDQQLTKWDLTVSEKEVAFLLLKGLSLKEVAEIRGTTEKTARVQSMAIYSKAGISGRSELSAFFLEDLLVPTPSPLSASQR